MAEIDKLLTAASVQMQRDGLRIVELTDCLERCLPWLALSYCRTEQEDDALTALEKEIRAVLEHSVWAEPAPTVQAEGGA